MSEPNWDASVVRAFLLAQLSEGEGAEVQRRSASDPAYATFIASVEEELLADYVRRRLSDTDRRAFEMHYTQLEGHAANVQFARVLAQSIEHQRRAGRHKIAWALALLVVGVVVPALWIQARTVTADLYPGIPRGAATESTIRVQRLTTTIRLRLHLAQDLTQAPVAIRPSGAAVDIFNGFVDSRQDLGIVRVPAAVFRPGEYIIQVSRDSPDAKTFLLLVLK